MKLLKTQMATTSPGIITANMEEWMNARGMGDPGAEPEPGRGARAGAQGGASARRGCTNTAHVQDQEQKSPTLGEVGTGCATHNTPTWRSIAQRLKRMTGTYTDNDGKRCKIHS